MPESSFDRKMSDAGRRSRAPGLLFLGAALLMLHLGAPSGLNAQDAADPQAGQRATTTSAGQAPSAIDEQIDVQVVETEIRVLDRRGRPITDLTRDDFRLLVDGREVSIDTFDLVTGPDDSVEAPSAAAVEGVESGPDPIFLVLYVDQRFLEPDDVDKVRADVRSFLETLPRNARIMLAAGGDGYEILVPFTEKADRVAAFLPDLHGTPGAGRLARQYLRLLSQVQQRRQQDGFRQLDAIGPADVSPRRGEPRVLLGEIEAFEADSQREIQASGRDLARLLTALGGLPGRKQVVYVGQRLPTGAGSRLLAAWQATFERRSGDPGGSSSESARLDDGTMDAISSGRRGFSAVDLFEDLARRSAAADVVFHALTASGLGRGRRLNVADDATQGPSSALNASAVGLVSDQSLGDFDGLRLLAGRTGGRYHGSGRDFDRFFGGVRGDLDTFYRLGWSAPPGDWPLEVELKKKRRRTEVLHSRVARVRSHDQIHADRTVAALTLPGDFENRLAVELEVGAPVPRREIWAVPVTVRIPVAELALLADRGAHAASLSIYATAGGFEHGASPVTKAVVPVRIRNTDLLTALGRKIDYKADIEMPALGGRVAVTVRDDLRPRTATLAAPVVSPPVPRPIDPGGLP